VAFDLLLGVTRLNWARRPAIKTLVSGDDWSAKDTEKLADETTTEINHNAKLVIALSKSKRLPDAEKATFQTFFRKWGTYNEKKKRRFSDSDKVMLTNFRLANQRFTARLETLKKLAETPLKPQAQFVPPGSTPSDSPATTTWPYVLGAGVALAGLGWLATK
jgi:hypothetical protein